MWNLEVKSYEDYTDYRECICAQEILILTCTEHASTTSPVYEAQRYDYEHQDKGTDPVWNFRDVMRRIES